MWAFGVPFLCLHALDLLPHRGGAPFWQRLLLIEDACSYGVCIIVPAMIYAVSRLTGLLAGK